MKRLFLLFSLVLSLGLSAKVTIQSTFNGCTLGKSTQSEVKRKMALMGTILTNQDESTITFEGTSLIADGIGFDKCVATFVDDTLYSLTFMGDNSGISANKIEIVKNKYEQLEETVNNSIMLQISRKIFCEQWGVDSSFVFVRGDDEYNIMIVENDTLLCFEYEAPQCLLRSTMRKFRALIPDQDVANAVKSVAGCEFGDSKQNVTAKFRSKSQTLLSSTDNEVIYYGVTIGGTYFKRASLYFMNNKFVACLFDTEYDTWRKDKAITHYQNLCAQYGRKYSNGLNSDDDPENMKSYYGMLQSDYEDGTTTPIVITMKKGESRGGDTYYYVTVSYFMRRLQQLFDDEI